MTRRFLSSWIMAGSLGALSCSLLLAGIGSAAAQTTNPTGQQTQPPTHSLGSGNTEANAADQYSAGSSAFLKVPLVNNIPGAIKPTTIIENPAANDPSAPQRGMQYFVHFNCVGCHAPNGGGGMGPSLSDGEFKYGSDPAHLFLVISHGAPLGMPAWGSVLPENVIWDLVAYVENLSKHQPEQEWGRTVSPGADLPALEQVPAEFKQSDTPWVFTEPFGNGQAPSASSSGASGSSLPNSKLNGH